MYLVNEMDFANTHLILAFFSALTCLVESFNFTLDILTPLIIYGLIVLVFGCDTFIFLDYK